MEPLDNFLDLDIKPRPIEPVNDPVTNPVIVVPVPEPVAPPVRLPEPRAIAPRGIREGDGATRGEILLQAIVLEARKEQTPVTKGALRNLIAKFSCEYGLDFRPSFGGETLRKDAIWRFWITAHQDVTRITDISPPIVCD
jgi:hypothetical protein